MYNVAFENTGTPDRWWTTFDSKEDFETWLKDQSGLRVLEKGATDERCITICRANFSEKFRDLVARTSTRSPRPEDRMASANLLFLGLLRYPPQKK
jgi:hypothetical protein